jgi:hypothetical protein
LDRENVVRQSESQKLVQDGNSKEETHMTKVAPAPQLREVSVEIGLDAKGNLVASPEYFYVSKSGNQEVRWVCAIAHEHNLDGPCFTVDFEKNGSPFYEIQFSSDASYSGLVRREVLPGPKVYEYTIRSGNKSTDPGGGVKP